MLLMKRSLFRIGMIHWLWMFLGATSAALGADISRETPRSAKPFPRVAMLWASIRHDKSMEAIARHDLVLVGSATLGLKVNRQPAGLADGYTPESVGVAQQRLRQIRELNPGVVILAEVLFYEWPDGWLPENHPWWLRKNDQRQQFWPGTHRMNWSDSEYRGQVVRQTVSLQNLGLDGAFYDNLREEPEPWVNFLKDVRQEVGDKFLLLANCGYSVGAHDFAAPFLNGFMYESGWSHGRREWDEVIRKMQHSELLLRAPRISLIERFEDTGDQAGWPGDAKRGKKPAADPGARRWSLAYALIVGDFFYLFSDSTSHQHDWYPEYDVKIGQPLGPGKRLNADAWSRDYEKGVVAVNLPGAKTDLTVNLDHFAKDTLTGEEGRSFVIPPGDGRILFRQPE